MLIAFKTFGCKANRYESDKLADLLIKDGHQIASAKDQADIYLVNTCTVTHIADRKCRQMIRSLKKLNPLAKIIVFGCGAKKESGNNYSTFPEIDFIATEPSEVINYLNTLPTSQHFPANASVRQYASPNKLLATSYKLNPCRTRAVIKIQDGCNNFCAYCIIPYVRGREISYPSLQIIKEIKEKEQQGFKEIVLTGINIGSYKDDTLDLAGLINKILQETGIPRLRLSSLEPQNYHDNFLTVIKEKRFCPHLHLSLQSGCDKILKLMNRKYSTKDYFNICEKLRNIRPDLTITTDIIVGFPGETEEDFQETYDFASKIAFLKIHVFPFSPRQKTAAATFQNIVPAETKKRRCNQLTKLNFQLSHQVKKSFLNQEKAVLFESVKQKNIWTGFTDNYLKVEVKSDKNFSNIIQKVKLLSFAKNVNINGEILSTPYSLQPTTYL